MSKRPFPLIQTVGVPTGTPQFEATRAGLLKAFVDKVPEEYYIPQRYIDDPPRDVSAIPRECGILTAEELEITENYDTVGLANAIATRRYTAVAVTRAFAKRAIICHQVSCCLTQWFPEMAERQAAALDAHLATTGKTVGPLHGVPISIKQYMPVAGTYSDGGFVSTTVFNEEDSLLVRILRELGAVFYVKTAQPQLIMHLESDFHLGRVLCPYNIHLSAGGSSGGEAALVALRGSVMGVGSDIGGSIRGPAGKCGIYGFKPTAHTLPMQDFSPGGSPAELNILASVGPMCRTLRDVDLFVRLVLAQKPHLRDPHLVPIPWAGLKTDIAVSARQPLKVGVMLTDGVIEPQPPVKRAMEWAVAQLSSSSFVEMKPFVPLRTADAMRMIRKMYWPQGSDAIRVKAESTGEPLHPLTEWIIKDVGAKPIDAIGVHELRVQRDAFRREFAADWMAQDVDVVLSPMHVGPAPAHDTSLYWNYTAIWNFVDYPGIVFPTPIRVAKKGAERYSTDEPLNNQDEHVRRLWDEHDYEGAPINLQLVAQRHCDNFLFGALDLLKESLQLP